MRHSSANSGLCTHFAIVRPCGTTPRVVRDRLGNKGCIVRLAVPAIQQGSDNLCKQVCRKVIALMIAERERKVTMADGPYGRRDLGIAHNGRVGIQLCLQPRGVIIHFPD